MVARCSLWTCRSTGPARRERSLDAAANTGKPAVWPASRRRQLRDPGAVPGMSAQDEAKLLVNRAKLTPLLSAAEEVRLAKRIEQGDMAARERMIESNL